MSNRERLVIRRRAIRVDQGSSHDLYMFSLTADELLRIADISRVSRDDGGKLIGYQRPEVRQHIQNITTYLDGDQVLFPNSLILALPSTTRFVAVRGPRVDDGLAEAGTLEIPIPRDSERKPAWIVDGQQRAIALSKCRRRGFPVPVNAFVADEVEVQRDQFLRVNNTKPLPRGLITELLPEISTVLPTNLSIRKAPSAMCDLLNRDPESPFRGLIKRASTPTKERASAVIADTTVVQMIQESLTSPSGCLFPYRNIATGETDFEGVRAVLIMYWRAVRETFPEAWGLSPHNSRLMHSVGLRAMGRLMDRIMSTVSPTDRNACKVVEDGLDRVKPLCRWTSGVWVDLGGYAWNELQNVPSHVRLLSNYLIRGYMQGGRTTI